MIGVHRVAPANQEHLSRLVVSGRAMVLGITRENGWISPRATHNPLGEASTVIGISQRQIGHTAGWSWGVGLTGVQGTPQQCHGVSGVRVLGGDGDGLPGPLVDWLHLFGIR